MVAGDGKLIPDGTVVTEEWVERDSLGRLWRYIRSTTITAPAAATDEQSPRAGDEPAQGEGQEVTSSGNP